jgi:integrase
MGIFRKADSKFWWLYLESTKEKIRTTITVGDNKGQIAESRKAARAEYHKRMRTPAAEIDPTLKPDITFVAWAAWYDDNVIAHRGASGAERERAILKRLIKDFGTKPDGTPRLLREFDQELVKEWRTERRNSGTVVEHFGGPKGPRKVFAPPTARSVNREVDLLQMIFTAAVPKYLTHSPLKGLPDLKVVTPRRRVMAVGEEEQILPHLAVDDRALVIMALDTLARMINVLDFRREDDHGTTALLMGTKNGTSYEVPISTRLRAALDAVPVDPKHPDYYFPRRRVAKTARDRRNVIAGMLRRACKKAHVPYGRGKGVTFHWGTRRTGTTRLLKAGGEGSIAAVQQIGGWKHVNVPLEIYREVVPEEMHALVELVGRDVKSVELPNTKGAA